MVSSKVSSEAFEGADWWATISPEAAARARFALHALYEDAEHADMWLRVYPAGLEVVATDGEAGMRVRLPAVASSDASDCWTRVSLEEGLSLFRDGKWSGVGRFGTVVVSLNGSSREEVIVLDHPLVRSRGFFARRGESRVAAWTRVIAVADEDSRLSDDLLLARRDAERLSDWARAMEFGSGEASPISVRWAASQGVVYVHTNHDDALLIDAAFVPAGRTQLVRRLLGLFCGGADQQGAPE